MAFFGSLLGLFRKPKEKEKVGTKWGEGQSSPKQNRKGAVAGWVTRTDARIKGRGGETDSDEDETPVMNVARGNSGARLRKGRPRGMHESGSVQDGSSVGVDGLRIAMVQLVRVQVLVLAWTDRERVEGR